MPSGPKKRKKEKLAAKKREDEELVISPSPQSPPPSKDKELEQGSVMERSNIDKELHTEEEGGSSESRDDDALLVEKEVVVETPEKPIYEVKDLGVEFVEGRVKVGGSNLGGEGCVSERGAEIVEEKKLSGEESMDPVSEQLLEASEEVQGSVPTSSLVYESEDVEEVGEGVPNMGTIIETTTVEMTANEDGHASLWNCCGLLDVFKSSRG